MSNTQISLKNTHQKYQHLPKLRIDFNWTKVIETDAINLLMARLLKRKYIKTYLYILNQRNNNSHISALFYLEKFQYDALVFIAVEAYWKHYTNGEGNIKEHDVTDNTITELETTLTSIK